jgi:cytochrome c-type biogenesis protein
MRRRGSKHLARAILFGVFFATGWTRCIGATPGAILTFGFSHETTGEAMVLPSSYVLGLVIPFLGLAILLDLVLNLVRQMQKDIRYFQWTSGQFLSRYWYPHVN